MGMGHKSRRARIVDTCSNNTKQISLSKCNDSICQIVRFLLRTVFAFEQKSDSYCVRLTSRPCLGKSKMIRNIPLCRIIACIRQRYSLPYRLTCGLLLCTHTHTHNILVHRPSCSGPRGRAHVAHVSVHYRPIANHKGDEEWRRAQITAIE